MVGDGEPEVAFTVVGLNVPVAPVAVVNPDTEKVPEVSVPGLTVFHVIKNVTLPAVPKLAVPVCDPTDMLLKIIRGRVLELDKM